MINLEEANIPLSVESLGDCIFRNDTALTTVTWPENFEAPELVDSDSNTNIDQLLVHIPLGESFCKNFFHLLFCSYGT